MDLIFILKLAPFALGLTVLVIGTLHAVRKPGRKNTTDRLPPNAYDPSGTKDDISI